MCNFDFCNLHFAFKRYPHFLVIFVISLVMSGCGTLIRYKEITPVFEKELKIKFKKPSKELRIGERLTYDVYWMKLPVGRVILEVKDLVEIDNRKAYHFQCSAFTYKWLNPVFRVEDFFESYLDKESLLPIKHIAIRNEGRYHAHMIFEYDWENKILNFQNLVDGTKKTISLPEKGIDQFSSFYYFRLQEILPGESLEFIINQGEKNWRLRAELKSVGVINFPFLGVFDSLMIEPYLYLEEKPFDKVRAWLWFSNDEARIPLMIKVHVNIPLVGTLFAFLTNKEYN